MARRKIKLDDFEAAIKDILQDYENHVILTSRQAVQTVLDEGVKQVKKNSQIFDPKHRPEKGRYYTGWTGRMDADRSTATGTIYNYKYPGLPHLLEHGHALVTGGRSTGQTKARPHIEQVEQLMEEQFMSVLRREL